MSKVLIAAAATAVGAGFVRLGVLWPKEGKLVAQGEFTDDQWVILGAEKMLRIAAAPSEAEVEAVATDDLRSLITAEIARLEAGDFEADGAPKVGALKERLPAQAKKITVRLVAEVWAELKPAS